MPQHPDDARVSPFALMAGWLAAALPPLLWFQVSPSASALGQCAAVALAGVWIALLNPGRPTRALWPLAAAAELVALMVGWSGGFGDLPSSLAVSALALIGAALVMAWAGSSAAQRPGAAAWFGAYADGLLVAGVLSALIAAAQVFAPDFSAGGLITPSTVPGRGVGNLRQANHLASLLQWAIVALVLRHERSRLSPVLAWATLALLVIGIELTGSRTGIAGIVALALWGWLDRRMSLDGRKLALGAPLLFALSAAAAWAFGQWSDRGIGVALRIGESAGVQSPNLRSNFWHNVLELIARDPWFGVGFGQFNFAWTLTSFPNRPTAYFDNAHSLPLQLAVELGLPAAGILCALLGFALWRAWRSSGAVQGAQGVVARGAFVMVLVIGLHSLIEYPLWYAYFLLPTAFAWGYAIGTGTSTASDAAASRSRWAAWVGPSAGVALAAGGLLAAVDYLEVASIFAAKEYPTSLQSRIERGQFSVFYAHHADYAAATWGQRGPAEALGFKRATHSFLNARLMAAWADYLAQQGDVDLARVLAARLREFSRPETADFFQACAGAASPPAAVASAPSSYRCEAPQAAHGWREFAAASNR